MKVSVPRTPGSPPSVTVVIPCYNYGHYLREATRSALEQDGVDARVIIVDDCSPDGSVEVARALAAEDPRITVIAHEVNRGHIATYNDGLAAVTTDYVTLVSADDLLAPGALGRATALMEANRRVGMVYGQPLEFAGEVPTKLRTGRAPYTWTVWGGHEWIRLACFRGRCFILSPEVVMRTDALREVGPYNADLPHSGDLEYWLRTASRWDVGRVNGRVQAYYRQHEANMHVTTYPGLPHDLRERMRSFAYLTTDGFAETSSRGRAYEARARRAVVREALALAGHELDGGGDVVLARELRDAAVELRRDESSRGRLADIGRRIAKASAGQRPSALQSARLAAWTFANRARWRIWANTGVS